MVNAWDQLLIKNGAKIVSLNESVAAVRTDQQQQQCLYCTCTGADGPAAAGPRAGLCGEPAGGARGGAGAAGGQPYGTGTGGDTGLLDYWTTGLLDYCIVNVLYRADGGHREGEDVRPGREPGRAAGQDV